MSKAFSPFTILAICTGSRSAVVGLSPFIFRSLKAQQIAHHVFRIERYVFGKRVGWLYIVQISIIIIIIIMVVPNFGTIDVGHIMSR